MDGQWEIRKSLQVIGDDDDVGRNPLQNFDLADDDGAPVDDEAALVLSAEAAGLSARQNRRGDRVRAHGQIMTEARVGRLVPACLHQAIQEALPRRLDFYENWLHSQGLHDGSIGLAPLTAVLGFLRTEGQGYNDVVRRAGVLAAEWTVASMSPSRRRFVGSLPRALRLRAGMRVALGHRPRGVEQQRGEAPDSPRPSLSRGSVVSLLLGARQAAEATLWVLRGDH